VPTARGCREKRGKIRVTNIQARASFILENPQRQIDKRVARALRTNEDTQQKIHLSATKRELFKNALQTGGILVWTETILKTSFQKLWHHDNHLIYLHEFP